uniref:Ig-like domain-containing protein n=1 Tax=Chelydra serpentina TaxID=8475 RepID=A0A8C3RZ34_CHESE
MNVLLIFLFMLVAPSGVLSQMQLRETGPGEVKPGESLTLTCTISGETLSSASAIWHWIRQPPGEGLVWLALIDRYGNTRYFPDIQNRTTISVNPSKDEFYLRLERLSPQDTATYYCARSTYQKYKPP